jgi:hypothetical protein
MPTSKEYRSINGSGNNVQNPTWGQAGVPLKRITRTSYDDGLSIPAGSDRPNPREISNIILDQVARTFNFKNATDYLWIWGQFVDHDIGLTTAASPPERFDIAIPQGDPWFDPAHTGDQTIPFIRSVYESGTGVRQQLNTQSSFIDASNVYGSTEERALALRMNNGTGKLKTGPQGLLPFNNSGMDNAPDSSNTFYAAGDVRANEVPTLTAMHGLWVMEHNRIAHELYHADSSQTGETIYQRAREKVIALNQAITFNEFLPLLLGENGISPYPGYNSEVDPGITNIFSTACYRLGHSLVSSELLRLKADLEPIAEGPLRLRDAFFDPTKLTVGGGIEPLLRGASQQVCEELDARTVGDLRNFLFGTPGMGGMDLAALNIQRGRDHGLPSYNDAREDLGLKRKTFDDISSDIETTDRLKKAYGSVDDIDVWVGGLAENRFGRSMLGQLFHTVCKLQFEALRDGDRFWYQNIYFGAELEELEATRLIDVIRRNTLIRDEIQDNIFRL